MMFSSIGFTIDVHYCGDELKSLSFFGEAEKCAMLTEVKESCKKACCQVKESKKSIKKSNQKCHVSKSACCHNERFDVATDGDFNQSKNIQLVDRDFSFISPQLYESTFIGFDLTRKNLVHLYKPPLLSKDIGCLVQVYRI